MEFKLLSHNFIKCPPLNSIVMKKCKKNKTQCCFALGNCSIYVISLVIQIANTRLDLYIGRGDVVFQGKLPQLGTDFLLPHYQLI